jgi:uncharacterized membrane protein YcaP (DUF421 family)
MDEIEGVLRVALGLGLDNKELGAGQVGLRAAVVYVATLAMVRLAKKRFMGRATAFDVILGIVLGSVVSRAITGNAPFGPALVAAAVLLGMHWAFSGIAVQWHGFGRLIKGRPWLLVRDGSLDEGALRGSHMTEHDLFEDLRGEGLSDLGRVAEARLERSGEVSVIKAQPQPKVIEVSVAEGVQTVRVEIGSGS